MPAVSNVDTSSTTTSNTSPIAQNGMNSDELSNMFLELLVAQISHQNPLDPMDGTQYVSQLAEFSSLESLQSIRTNTGRSLNLQESTHALEAVSLVGQELFVPSSRISLSSGGTIDGRASIGERPEKVVINAYDSQGRFAGSQKFDSPSGDSLSFSFDDLEPGEYTIQASVTSQGETTQGEVRLKSEVERVSFNETSRDVLFRVKGLGEFSLTAISQSS